MGRQDLRGLQVLLDCLDLQDPQVLLDSVVPRVQLELQDQLVAPIHR